MLATVEVLALAGAAVVLVLLRKRAPAPSSFPTVVGTARDPVAGGGSSSAVALPTAEDGPEMGTVSGSRCEIQAERRRTRTRRRAAAALGVVLAVAIPTLWLVLLQNPAAVPWAALILTALVAIAAFELWLSPEGATRTPRSAAVPAPRATPSSKIKAVAGAPTPRRARARPSLAQPSEHAEPKPASVAQRGSVGTSSDEAAVASSSSSGSSSPTGSGSYWDRSRTATVVLGADR